MIDRAVDTICEIRQAGLDHDEMAIRACIIASMRDFQKSKANMTRIFSIGIVLAIVSAASVRLVAWQGIPPGKNGSELEKLEIPGVENIWRIDAKLVSGGDPGGLAGLEGLRRLGVRAIVSVDGAAPDVESARKLGLRYVHIPIGYDGIDPSARMKLTRAFAEIPGPIYVHCHHGKHRGPAAAAIMARAGLGWSTEQAVDFMAKAGTSPDYPGLYDSVRSFRVPSPAEIRADKEPLPEVVEVPALVELMVQMDDRFDRLKSWLKNAGNSQKSKEMSKVDPRQEAILLRELTRESARLPECRERPKAFLAGFEGLESELSSWIAAIDHAVDQPGSTQASRDRFAGILKRATDRCTGCHRAFRDR